MTTPTPDRLAALEAALRQVDLLAAEMGHSDTLGFNEAQERILEITTPLLAALDAASPLTTPTPDKGAIHLPRVLDDGVIEAIAIGMHDREGAVLDNGLAPFCRQPEDYRNNMRERARAAYAALVKHLEEDGKVLKPEGWQPPDLRRVLGLRAPFPQTKEPE